MLRLVQQTDDDSLLREEEWRMIVERLNFSPREAEIVQYAMEDLKEQTIARRLDISIHTVHTHLKRLYSKLGISSRVELILLIFREYAFSMRSAYACNPMKQPAILRKAA